MLDLLNRYAHGFVAIPTILSCRKKGLFNYIQKIKKVSLKELSEKFHANSGHLKTALNLFCSLGWMSLDSSGNYSLNNEDFLLIPENIMDVWDFDFKIFLAGGQSCYKWIEQVIMKWSISQSLIVDMLDGMFLIPLLLELKKEMDAAKNNEVLPDYLSEVVKSELAELLQNKNWIKSHKDLTFTPEGRFIFDRIEITQTTYSYQPMLMQIEELIFGDSCLVFQRDNAGCETHISRDLNVRGSGFQHEKYFKDFERFILKIFGTNTYSRQPEFIVDCGCGDGSLLRQLYQAIKSHTSRGKVLEEFPLVMIGVDYNKEALEETEKTLVRIPHILITGDIGNPGDFIGRLENEYGCNAKKMLHIRSFLDHDRPYNLPKNKKALAEKKLLSYEGCYTNNEGREIPCHEVVQSTVEHLGKWKDVINDYGLILLELHCLDYRAVYKNIDLCENLHYDAYHSFSRQFLHPPEIFYLCAAENGLFIEDNNQKYYPKFLSYKRITLSSFKKKNYVIKNACINDLNALERLETGWPENLRNDISVLRKRLERYAGGQFVIIVDSVIVGALYTRKIGSPEFLNGIEYKNMESVFDKNGPVVQIVGITVLPEFQNCGYGSYLLKFLLQYCVLQSGVTKIVGVSRCKNFKDSTLTFAEYINKCDNNSVYDDPILNFHKSHGAKIVKPLYNYRPEDRDNDGHGVLIEYSFNDDLSTPNYNTQECSLKSYHQDFVKSSVLKLLGDRKSSSYSDKSALKEMGLDSLDHQELRSLLVKQYGEKLSSSFLFEYSTVEAISTYFQNRTKFTRSEKGVIKDKNSSNDMLIAVTGISFRLPGCGNSKEKFWELLEKRRSAIKSLPSGRWKWDDAIDLMNKHRGINQGGFLDRLDFFDASFFNISPAEARLMDPQQRFLMELCWQVLEDSGYNPEIFSGTRTGFFIGGCNYDYRELLRDKKVACDSILATGTSPAILANRISYYYNLKGPSVHIDTACSSSLVALHEAVESIRRGECGKAIAGGVSLICSPTNFFAYYDAGMLSPAGVCKTFDSGAKGYVRGEGAGLVLLKPLKEAEKDKDHIYGIIRGSAVSHGGRSNSLTAPNPASQKDLIIEVYNKAGVTPDSVSYIEAHGTGTPLGDPIEVDGLKQAFGAFKNERDKEGFCGLGSVKTNIGHLEAAAGIAGLIKVLLCLKHKKLPGCVNFEKLNPEINIEKSPFYIIDKIREWKNPGNKNIPLRGGVSSFGFGGTIAHVLLEEYNSPNPRQFNNISVSEDLTFPLSAKNEATLKKQAKKLADFLKKNRSMNLKDIAFTLQTGRASFNLRVAVKTRSVDVLIEKLELFSEEGTGSEIIFYSNIQEHFDYGIENEDIGNRVLHNWLKGKKVNWNKLWYNEDVKKVPLPVYPFKQESHWFEDFSLTNENAMDIVNLLKNVKHKTKKKETLLHYIHDIINGIIGGKEKIDVDQPLMHMGVDSLMALKIINRLNDGLNMEFQSTLVFNYPTVNELTEYIFNELWNSLSESNIAENKREKKELCSHEPIAIIGLGCRFPGEADCGETFWDNLIKNKAAVSEIPANRWDLNKYFKDNDSESLISTKYGSFLNGIDKFDARFFEISPVEARTIDPQQRLILETAWAAIENAGIDAAKIKKSNTSVFLGVTDSEYGKEHIRPNTKKAKFSHFITSSMLSGASGRLSYFFDFRGPSVTINTACSSSLVAIHNAVKSLRSRESDMALSGGVNLLLSPEIFIGLSELKALSSDGKCKAFDDGADGFGRGEGCGIIVLKRLSDAERDNDNILALIHGSAVNQDGRSVGLAAPNGRAQEEVIRRALKDSNLRPEQISYVEAHGTGTKLGDPIEIEALGKVFSNKKNKLLVGSVKTNIGHLETAAGVAGVIKVVLAMRYKMIPRSLYFNTPSRYIPWNKYKIKIVSENMPWKSGDNSRMAGISSFGMSGTNAHLILGEYIERKERPVFAKRRNPFILPLSAKTDWALNELVKRFIVFLKETKEEIFDLCFTAAAGRSVFSKRMVVWGSEKQELIRGLENYLDGKYSFDQFSEYELPVNIKASCSKDNGLKELGKNYIRGENIDWLKWYDHPRYKKVILPGYPFEKESFWLSVLKEEYFAPKVKNEVDKLIYSLEWISEENESSVTIHPGQMYCLFCDGRGTGLAIKKYVESQGAEAVVISREKLRSECTEVLKKVSSSKYMSLFMIYLYPLDIEFYESFSRHQIEKELKHLYEDLLYFLRNIHSDNKCPPYKLWLVTQNCITHEMNSIPNLILSTLWGFGASLDHELRENWGGLIDIEEAATELNSRKIVLEVLSDKSDRISFYQGGRYVQRLVKNDIIPSQKKITVSKDGAFIITGGMGRIGYRLACWLIEKGAKTLVLTGRSDLSSEKKELLERLNSQGANVSYYKCDVTCENELMVVISGIKKNGISLKGIIHAAGVGDMIPAVEHTWGNFRQILAPKTEGVWNLYTETKKMDLDFFLVISSMSSFSGGTGNTAYSAANEFLNAFARFGKVKKIPVTSINLALWGEGGMSDGEIFDFLENIGLKPIYVNDAIKALEKVMSSDLCTSAIISIDWELYTMYMTQKQKGGVFKLLNSVNCNSGIQPQSPFGGMKSTEEVHTLLTLTFFIQDQVADILGFASSDDAGLEIPFMEMGFDSVLKLGLIERLNNTLGLELSSTMLFNYSTITLLAEHLWGLDNLSLVKSNGAETVLSESFLSENLIAVIGMDCRFPGAENPEELWDNLYNGIDSITKIPGKRWNNALYYDSNPDIKGKSYSQYGGFINGIDLFDAEFFDISPAEAREMDPQQRLLLEVSWHAFEDAGVDASTLKGSKTGVFIGICTPEYSHSILLDHSEKNIESHYLTGSAMNAASGKIAYFYDLAGPAMAIDTACSSSLVSIHMAVKSLLTGESDMALTGGVNALVNPVSYIALSRIHALSVDGKCKTFDDSADGYVRAEGCGLLVLKRLKDAQSDGDRILGVIRGSAVNQNGKSSGKTAPNGLAQEKVIMEAMEAGKIFPQEVSYIEAHGTGTRLGDPIEVDALGNIFKERRSPLLLGSVKTNIGHCESAAGIAGVIKVLLSLKHKIIPPNLHFKTPNKHVHWNRQPFKVVTQRTPWDGNGPKTAGISSFGISGTNAHIILQEYVKDSASNESLCSVEPNSSYQILTLSAKNQKALQNLAREYIVYLEQSIESIEDICYTSNISRTSLERRISFIGKNRNELINDIMKFLQNERIVEAGKSEHRIRENRGEVFFEADTQSLISMKVQFKDRSSQLLLKGHRDDDDTWKHLLEKLSLLYSLNISINWKQFCQICKRKKVILPRYGFIKKSYWNVQKSMKETITHFIGEDKLGFISGHVIHGSPVMPGAGYFAIIYTYLRGVITGLEIKQFYNPAKHSGLSLEVQGESSQINHLRIVSRDKNTNREIEHVRGSMNSGIENSKSAVISFDAVKMRCSKENTHEEIYSIFNRIGFGYQKDYRRIERVWFGYNEVLGLIDCNNSSYKEHDFSIFPEFLDSVFQLGAPLLYHEHSQGVVPVFAERVRFFAPLKGKVWGHLILNEEKESFVNISLRVFDTKGNLLFEIEEFIGQRLNENSLNQHVDRDNIVENIASPVNLASNADKAKFIEEKVKKLIADNSSISPEQIELNKGRTFFSLGLDSIGMTGLRQKINELFHLDISQKQLFFEIDNFNKIVEYITSHQSVKIENCIDPEKSKNIEHFDIESPMTTLPRPIFPRSGLVSTFESMVEKQLEVLKEIRSAPTVEKIMLEQLRVFNNLREKTGEILNDNLKSAITEMAGKNTHENKNPINKVLKQSINGQYQNDGTPVSPCGNDSIFQFPMSSVQKRIYTLCQTADGDSNYHLPAQFDVKGNFDLDNFKKAIGKIISRHSTFRTGFELYDNDFIQKIYEPFDIEIKYIKASGDKMDDMEKELKQPYHFAKPPLFRVMVVELKKREFKVLLGIHHLIFDSYSYKLFIKELVDLYNQKELTVKPSQYSDYVEYEKEYFSSGDYHKDEKFWTSKFRDTILPIELPLDFPRPAVQSFQGDSIKLHISGDKLDCLKQYARDMGINLNILLIGASYILLFKLSGSSTITIGSLVPVRDEKRFVKTMGMFVNTIVFKGVLSNSITIPSLFKNVKEDVLSSYMHQDYPYEHLVEKSIKKRDLSRNPFFDFMFSFENHSQKLKALYGDKGEEFSNFTMKTGDALCDLYILTGEYPHSLSIDFKYNTRLFKKETIERWSRYYNNILDQLPEAHNSLISVIQLITDREKHKIIKDFNNTQNHFPVDKTIQQLFEEQAVQNADRTAVTAPAKMLKATLLSQAKEILSYKQLNENANRIAHLLIAKGVTPETIVGIMVERSLEMITGILGILKAGGAYMPIDPHHPESRINFMLEDSETQLLLTHKDLAKNLNFSGKLIYLDDSSLYKSDQIINPQTACRASNIAYVIYTSGSTGKPKGTLIEHRSVVNRLKWMQKYYPLSGEDTILQKTPYTFDVSVWELFWWAFEGAKLSFLTPGGEKDPSTIVDEIKRSNITVAHFVPSMLSPFLEYLQGQKATDKLGSLKQVFTSGEALSIHQVKKFNAILQKANGTKLTNLYGPTEATVDVSFFDCTKSEEFSSIPIGKPIDNIKLYIVDESMKLQPIGVAGEICISGIGLARGYLNRPDLTKVKFVSNLFDNHRDYNRLYKTGDIARWMPDGNIHYLGRMDGQLKIRGNRIEPGEIESVLSSNPHVKECLVHPMHIDDAVVLCAYYVSDRKLDVQDMKNYLQKQLPEYMVPSYFVKLDEIPLTSNGKADRKALPEPDNLSESDKVPYSAPTNELEGQIVAVWETILKKKKIGINDNFFNFGGDSIKAVRLLNLLNSTVSFSLKVADLYEHQTPFELGQFINSVDISASADSPPAIGHAEMEELKERIIKAGVLKDEENIEDIYPMSNIEKGMVFHSLKEAGKSVYHDQHAHTLVYEDFDPELYKKAFVLLVDKHEILRAAFDMENFEQPVQIIYKKVSLPIEEFDLAWKIREAQEFYINNFLKERRTVPFEVTKAPLWHLTLFFLGEGCVCLVWEFHHAILDGWSNVSVIKELHDIYLKLLEDKNYVPQKLASSYKHYVAEELAESEGDMEFWKRELAGYNRLDFTGILPLSQPGDGRDIYFYDLGSPLLKKLTGVCRKYSVDIKSACFAAYLYTIGMLSYDRDITLGVVTHTRPVFPDGDKIFGCFLNTLPVRYKIDASLTWKEFLLGVHKKLMDLKPHEKTPLFEIARYADAKGAKNPFFETLFNFFNFPGLETMAAHLDSEFSVQGYEHTNTVLDFNLNLTLNKFVIYFNYSTSVLNSDHILSMCGYFEQVLKKMIGAPDTQMDKRDILSRQERELLLTVYNNTFCDKPRVSITQKVEDRMESDRDNIALVAGTLNDKQKRQFTYGQLQRKVNALAAELVKRGAAPGIHVGIALPRRVEMIVAMLAILRTGAAYIPLDIKYPKERLAFMLNDSNAGLLVTSKTFSEYIPSSIIAIYMDTFEEERTDDDDSRTLYYTPYPEPDNPAYLIYTSGSSGIPKGVMITHQNIYNFILGMNRVIDFLPDYPIVSVTTISFDIFVLESLLPLVLGVPIVLADEEEQQDPHLLSRLIKTQDVKMIQTTPSRMKLLFENAPETGLTHILVGGEAFPEDLLTMLQNSSNAKLYNVYGPTETTVWSTVKDVTDDTELTIGKPIANTQIYILDSEDQPVSPGSYGHLCIGGAGVALGYYNRTNLSRERFIPNPFISCETIYKTGDLARWLPDGNLEFFGRIDRQIKIRGHRIEPGEIEQRLLEHNSVKECAVVALNSKDGGLLLCAYIIPDLKAKKSGRSITHERHFDFQSLVLHPALRIASGQSGLYLLDQGSLNSCDPQESLTPACWVNTQFLSKNFIMEEGRGQNHDIVLKKENNIINKWHKIWEHSYADFSSLTTFNTMGWNSSYTEKAIPGEEMKEWLLHTTERISSFYPHHVLEIGCGTGMLLFKLMDLSTSYTAWDIAGESIEYINRVLKERGMDSKNINLQQKAAHDFSGIAPESFDSIILNSVIQYFPGGDYLVKVLEKALFALKDEGCIFIGDVRNYDLLEAFHTDTVLFKSPENSSFEDVKRQIEQRCKFEKELLVSPLFFYALQKHFPEIGHVEVRYKKSTYHNEMNLFRYDVFLYKNMTSCRPADICLDWQEEQLSLKDLSSILLTRRPLLCQICSVPNKRVYELLIRTRFLRENESTKSIDVALDALSVADIDTIDPGELCGMNFDGYDAEPFWAGPDRDDCFTLILRRQKGSIENFLFPAAAPSIPYDPNWKRLYVHSPLDREDNFADELKSFLQSKLPDWMVPTFFIKINSLPMTPNGKVDKNALPAPQDQDYNIQADQVPRTEREKKLAAVWQKVLDVESFGVGSNFFKIGGHSLNAISLISRIKNELGVEVPLSYLFDHPTIKELSIYIGEKSEDAQTKNTDIPLAVRGEYYELSAAQKRIFLLHQLEHNSTAYNLPGALEIKGPLDTHKFYQVFKELTQRHESLRTYFEIVDGIPVQKILPVCKFVMDCIPVDDSEKIPSLLQQNVKPFELSCLPLFRTKIFEISSDHFIFFLDIHHIITDGRSFEIMIKELLDLYNCTELTPVKIQYKDFTYWQKDIISSENIKTQKEYWIKKFSGELPVMNLNTDFKRPKIQSSRGSKMNFTIETAENIKAFASKNNVSLYMVLLALYNVLLSKYGAGEDIVVGSPSAGRNHYRLENCIGMFVNTLVMRNQPNPETSFTHFLKEVRKTALEAFENQDYQFDRLVDELDIARDLSRNPFFDTMFALQTIGKKKYHSGALEFVPYEWNTGISLFDLSLMCWDMGDTIEASFEYCADLFLPETIERMVFHFKEIIKNTLKSPGLMIKDIKMITPEEEAAALKGYGTGQYVYSKPVIQSIEEQAAKTPLNIALRGLSLELDQTEVISLTYEELFEKITNLAAVLQHNGITSGSVAGIMIQRSIEMIIAVLAVQKAGAAYVPIDPDYPQERVQYIIDDSNLKTLLAGNVDFLKLKSLNIEQVIDVSSLNTSLITHHSLNRDYSFSLNDDAYIMYTSGSTGKPKGVRVTQGNIAAYTSAFLQEFKLTDKDVVIQQASYSFDTFVEEVYPILMRGGMLVVTGRFQVLDINALLECINNNGVSLISCSPQLLHELNKRSVAPSIHTYISGGDVLKWEAYNNLVTRAKVYNTYGPTETTVCASYHRCSRTPVNNVPIGRPVSNCRVYVMDRWGRPVPEGLPGELWIGGPCVTSGYVGLPELTKKKFIDTAFCEGKVFKTGDLVRFNNEGFLEFLGRSDSQVKIRGYRIEPGEIVSRLLKYPDMENAYVHAVLEDENKYLCAYYCIKKKSPSVGELRAFLLSELPEFMVPSYFIYMDELPLTSHGKINKKALPLPNQLIYTGKKFKEPEGEAEKKVAEIWKRVLHLEKISSNDDFFELGGNSLKAVSIVSAIDSEFSIRFPLVYFFKNPTILATALYLTGSAIEHIDYLGDKPLLLNKKHKRKIFCFPPLAAYSIFYKRLAEELTDCSVYSFGFIKSEDRIAKYADLIIEVDPEGPYLFMGYCSGANLAFEVSKELETRGHEVSDIIMFDAARRMEQRTVYPYMVNGFLEEMKKLIETLPGSINNSTREELLDRSKAYYHYFQDMINSGSINGNIHQIMSEQEISNNYGWDISTYKEYTIHQGRGIHFLMLEHDNIVINSKIVKEKILKKIR